MLRGMSIGTVSGAQLTAPATSSGADDIGECNQSLPVLLHEGAQRRSHRPLTVSVWPAILAGGRA